MSVPMGLIATYAFLVKIAMGRDWVPMGQCCSEEFFAAIQVVGMVLLGRPIAHWAEFNGTQGRFHARIIWDALPSIGGRAFKTCMFIISFALT